MDKYCGDIKSIVIQYFGKRVKKILGEIDDEKFLNIEEIRVRLGKPLYMRESQKEYFLGREGIVVLAKAYIPEKEDILQSLELISGFSAYAFQEEIRQGYITLPRGIRVGIGGKIVAEENYVKSIKNISSLNFRIPREVVGCCNKVIKYIIEPCLQHTLIISPPSMGKTTLLRDIVRYISDSGYNVGVVDERSEIAGTYLGMSQNDVGIRTDILDRCPKSVGMTMLLRSMSPQVIAVDEIGGDDDINAINNILCAGVKLICTIHGNCIEDLKKTSVIKCIIENRVFQRYIILDNKNGVGSVSAIYNENFESMLE